MSGNRITAKGERSSDDDNACYTNPRQVRLTPASGILGRSHVRKCVSQKPRKGEGLIAGESVIQQLAQRRRVLQQPA